MKACIWGRFLMAGMLVAGLGVASAADKNQAPQSRSDANVVRGVRNAIVDYSHYSIFDDVNFQVENGSVRLVGAVTEPYKKTDLAKTVRHVEGVTAVQNDLRVLPLSPDDVRLRQRVAHLIYSDPMMTKYAIQAIKPIHIIVENGHVTLDGVVASTADKRVAGIRANSGMSIGKVVNNLQVEHPSS